MPQLITLLHQAQHQFALLPVVLFCIALLLILVSGHADRPVSRYGGYLFSLAFLSCCVLTVLVR
jgi:hypothetical protein